MKTRFSFLITRLRSDYQAPSLMNLNKRCNFDARGQTELPGSVMWAKIASSDFYLLADCEKWFLRQKNGN